MQYRPTVDGEVEASVTSKDNVVQWPTRAWSAPCHTRATASPLFIRHRRPSQRPVIA
jgi:hypothetical protein